MKTGVIKKQASSDTTKKKQTKNGPGPGRPTRLQAEQRNIELLEKALDLFLERGYSRTSIEGIAAEVGMAKRTVYAQFKDKKSLFKASLQRAIDDWIVPVEDLYAIETDNFEETLLRVGNLLVDNILTPKGMRLLRITNAESGNMPEIGTYAYTKGTGPTLDYLANLFVRRGPVPVKPSHANKAALAFMDLVIGGPGNMSALGISINKVQLKRNTAYRVQLFLHGFLGVK